MIRPFLLCSLFSVLVACSETPEESRNIEQIMGLGNGGDFRGNAMGDDVKKVFTREAENVVYNMPDEITCRIPLEMVNETFYEVNYSFDEGELNHIQLDLFPGDADGVARLKKDFSEFYSRVHEQVDGNPGQASWLARSSRGKDVIIRMSDRTKTLGKPCLSITFLEEK